VREEKEMNREPGEDISNLREAKREGVPGIRASSQVRFGGIRSKSEMEASEALNGITGAGPR